MNKKILICTGGTGGHVIPAVNFGNFMINKGFECCLILDQRGNKFSKNFLYVSTSIISKLIL